MLLVGPAGHQAGGVGGAARRGEAAGPLLAGNGALAIGRLPYVALAIWQASCLILCQVRFEPNEKAGSAVGALNDPTCFSYARAPVAGGLVVRALPLDDLLLIGP